MQNLQLSIFNLQLVGRFGCMLLLWLAGVSAALSHQLDEYLQATLVDIEPGVLRLQMNLTPGVAVAGRVLALIDRDSNGVISTNEASAYFELLKRELSVQLDGRDLHLRATHFFCPDLTELRTGWAFIQVEYSASMSPLTPGLHKLTITNRHLSTASSYLLNATLPRAGMVQITAQNRTDNQSAGEIQFRVFGAKSSGSSLAAASLTGLLVLALGVLWTRRDAEKVVQKCWGLPKLLRWFARNWQRG